ncbi:hypothetical protein SODALDRAFT_324078 [Sodiomyces alkalinus F11]|uniref:Uncharacterized protein n=1 Tax=Sodiomyces alkalinus (strain CBS 110278 / VKM F-3762 / F11) TaxID=1314773 RepID=A0A3N2PVW5_SODAK|nr:hypothetical protein SODALDRAFT_324078 [Sodiomyces alkalinus F11]ROT38641.1 hypothetical protein SODALDRAFT_324078 [Sodiomyces alkalinus F11]
MSSTDDDSCIATYTPSRTRQRIRKPAPVLEVPHIEENADERKRVLNVLAQRTYPQRPEAARDPLALYNLAYDMGDAAEGVLIWGSDPYDVAGWEVGQVFFERWWFILDRGVVEQNAELAGRTAGGGLGVTDTDSALSCKRIEMGLCEATRREKSDTVYNAVVIISTSGRLLLLSDSYFQLDPSTTDFGIYRQKFPLEIRTIVTTWENINFFERGSRAHPKPRPVQVT